MEVTQLVLAQDGLTRLNSSQRSQADQNQQVSQQEKQAVYFTQNQSSEALTYNRYVDVSELYTKQNAYQSRTFTADTQIIDGEFEELGQSSDIQSSSQTSTTQNPYSVSEPSKGLNVDRYL